MNINYTYITYNFYRTIVQTQTVPPPYYIYMYNVLTKWHEIFN